ncbi:MAG TPA: peptidylprolyl isomerase [Solirubrobacterales bacterium]|nr:peptidylprolyl isomerase [Solirubrobacterales bacterium]
MSLTHVDGGEGSELRPGSADTARSSQAPRVAFGALITARKAVAASFALFMVAGCGGGGEETSTEAQLPAGCSRVQAPPPKEAQLSPPTTTLRGAATATVETSCGSFAISLDTTRAPKTASSFAYLAREGVYDNTLFHRIEPGFVIQGGDPSGTGSGGPGYFVDELPPANLSYTQGVVAMAKTAAEPPGRSGSQFFIVTVPDAGLTPDYALLGRVSSGFDVVQRIEQLGTAGGRPKAPVLIRRVTVKAGT